MNKTIKIASLTGVLGLVIGGLILAITVSGVAASIPEPEFHEHANFAVFLNGEQVDFARGEFMHVVPCEPIASTSLWTKLNPFAANTANAHSDKSLEDADDYSDWIHMHDLNGGVIHVHREGLTYHDFFVGLGMYLDAELFVDEQENSYASNTANQLRFFINGEEVSDLPDREVRDLDRVLITYGSSDRSQASIDAELAAIPVDACVSSGSCDHRGAPPAENCGVVSKNPWLLEQLGINLTD